MNRQRKVLITTTYNELGIIIDTKAEEVEQPDLQPTCNQLATDCISRQAAIDTFLSKLTERERKSFRHVWTTVEVKYFTEKILEQLPSAQPVNYRSTKLDSSSQLKLNNDLISRQDVLKILSSKNAAWDAYDKVKRLPPAQPQRKTGKWIDNDKINFPQCSECGMWIDVMQQSGEMNYCPHCGADMRGESDEMQ